MDNISIARSAYAAFNRLDLAAILAALDPEIIWRPAEGNPYRPAEGAWIGHDAIVQSLFVKLAGEWEDFGFHPEKYRDADGGVAVEGRYVGTYRSTGRKLNASACHIVLIGNGRITHFHQYMDTAQQREVMGLAF
jgi:ketosteroid isomerase-like protein